MVEDGGGDDPFVDENSSSSSDDESSSDFIASLPYGLQAIMENDPSTTSFHAGDDRDYITSKAWARIGREISNNTHLQQVMIFGGALNDDRMSSLFRGLTRSRSIREMILHRNELSVAGVRSMVPFLQNANNLTYLTLDENNLQTEGFNVLFRALCDSPIETLNCRRCGIESIEIDREHIPRNLDVLSLSGNSIGVDGCRELSKLLLGGDATLKYLFLESNNIDDEGVEILVDALKNNASLKHLELMENDGISMRGLTLLLKLVNDVSSIEATLQSNHTLEEIFVIGKNVREEVYQSASAIMLDIVTALGINRRNNPEEAGRMKVIQTQLHSQTRAELCRLQGIECSMFNEIDPLLLPEVLSLIGRHHGQGELYIAVLQSIMSLLSTVNLTECTQQERAYHAAKVAEHEAIAAEHRIKMEELDAKLVSMAEASEGEGKDDQLEHRSKRRRE